MAEGESVCEYLTRDSLGALEGRWGMAKLCWLSEIQTSEQPHPGVLHSENWLIQDVCQQI